MKSLVNIPIRKKGEKKPNLGDEDYAGFGLADAAAAILADEAETCHAGGAHLPMPTWTIRNPFKSVSAHRTAIIHVSLFQILEIKNLIRC